jgi:hypothetical protein
MDISPPAIMSKLTVIDRNNYPSDRFGYSRLQPLDRLDGQSFYDDYFRSSINHCQYLLFRTKYRFYYSILLRLVA